MKSLSKTEVAHPDGTVDEALGGEWNERQWDLVSAMATVLKVPMTKDFASGYAAKTLQDTMGQQLLAAETNNSLIMFARKDLRLRWNPAALFQYPSDVGIFGPFKELSQQPPDRKDA